MGHPRLVAAADLGRGAGDHRRRGSGFRRGIVGGERSVAGAAWVADLRGGDRGCHRGLAGGDRSAPRWRAASLSSRSSGRIDPVELLVPPCGEDIRLGARLRIALETIDLETIAVVVLPAEDPSRQARELDLGVDERAVIVVDRQRLEEVDDRVVTVVAGLFGNSRLPRLLEQRAGGRGSSASATRCRGGARRGCPRGRRRRP